MYVDIRARRAGKTWDCIRALKRDPRVVLLVPTHIHRDHCIRAYKLTPDEAGRVRTAEKPLRGLDPDARVIVDNLDSVLVVLLGRMPAAVTLTAALGSVTNVHHV